MYTSEDYERFYIRYQAEAMPRGESMQSFCSKNKVPYNLFNKWYTDTRHKLVPITVDGLPTELEQIQETSKPLDTVETKKDCDLRIMIDIKMTNGLHVSRRGMTYQQLKSFITNLEMLC